MRRRSITTWVFALLLLFIGGGAGAPVAATAPTLDQRVTTLEREQQKHEDADEALQSTIQLHIDQMNREQGRQDEQIQALEKDMAMRDGETDAILGLIPIALVVMGWFWNKWATGAKEHQATLNATLKALAERMESIEKSVIVFATELKAHMRNNHEDE